MPLLLFSVASSFTPGPNNFMVMNSGLSFGLKRSIPHYLGICLGFPAMVLIVALGFGTIFIKYVWIKQVLKILGSAYILYLAIQTLRATYGAEEKTEAKPFGFVKASLFQWVNPKAWVMAVGTISIFTITENYFNNALIISILFMITCLAGVGIWLVFGTWLKKILKKESHRRWFNISMAICLVASIALNFVD